jgi:hypothetical protein
MTELVNIELPNGTIIEGVPANISPEVLKDKAIKNGLANAEDFNVATVENEAGFLKSNLDIPFGIGGALAGAKAGAMTGVPPLIPVGMVLGGALGTGTGSLTSDYLTKDELDFDKAVKESLISIGFDVGTLGAGKVIKPAFLASKKALGFTPKEVAEEIASSSKVSQAGSEESLAQTQKILEGQGSSLTRFQTGKASALEIFSEKIAEAGLLSGQESLRNIAKVNEAAQKALDEVMTRVDLRTGIAPSDIGDAMFDTVSAGRIALSETYEEGLNFIQSQLVNKTVNATGVKNALQNFLKQNTEKTFDIIEGKSVAQLDKASVRVVGGGRKTKNVSTLDPATVKFINEQLTKTLELPNMSANTLLAIDKKITQQIKQFGDINSPSYNTTADRELGELQDLLKNSLLNTLKQADPKASAQYRALKTDYKIARNTLFPKINDTVINNAEKEDFEALGKLLTTQTNTDKISAFMRSIDEAYKQIGRRSRFPIDIPYGTAKEAKQAVKQSFLKTLLPTSGSPDFDIATYNKLASTFSRPAEDKRLKIIMGEDYTTVKKLFNLFADASKRPEGTLGTLFLRSKEYSSVTEGLSLAQGLTMSAAGAGGYALGGTVGAILTPAVVLTAPIFLAKMATNKKAVNRLIALDKKKFINEELREKAVAAVISDVMDGLSEEEQAELRNYFRPQSN